MTVKMPSILKAENRSQLVRHGMKTIERIQHEVIAEADKKIGDVANFEKKYHTIFASLQSKQNI
ncbi:MAG: hypothetical protein AB7S65_11435 [Sulfuricurvum sp.]